MKKATNLLKTIFNRQNLWHHYDKKTKYFLIIFLKFLIPSSIYVKNHVFFCVNGWANDYYE